MTNKADKASAAVQTEGTASARTIKVMVQDAVKDAKDIDKKSQKSKKSKQQKGRQGVKKLEGDPRQ